MSPQSHSAFRPKWRGAGRAYPSTSRQRPRAAHAPSIAPFQMIFEISERLLPVFAIGRSHRLVIEIDDPLILFGIERRFPRQGQPHEAARALRPNIVAAGEKRLSEQSLRLEVPLVGGEKQP